MPDLLELNVNRRRLKPGVVLLAAVLLLILLFLAALAVGWLLAKQRVRAEIERIRAAGEPVSPEDLEAFYFRPPADRDATQLWLDAIEPFAGPQFVAAKKDIPIVGETAEELPSAGEPWPRQPAVESFLAEYGESLELMHRAAQLGGAARYPIAFADGYQMTLDHLQRLREGARLLLLESEIAARHGDAPAAADAIQAMFAAAHSLKNEPTLVSQLVRLALDGMARDQLQRRLSDSHFTDDRLAAIDRQLAMCDYEAAFHRAMLATRVESFTFFSDPASLGTQAPSAASAVFRPGDQAVYLRLMRKLIEAFQIGSDLSGSMSDVEREVAELGRTPLAHLRCPLSLLALPAMQPCADALNRGAAYRDSARVAVAVERFRLRHAEPPKTLDALIPEFLPEVPLDPFDGQPLRYRLDAGEYAVYSLGADLIDQGGQADDSPQPGMPPDLVFRVPLEQPRANEGEQP
ncbi:MAG TPA: hypothetical protein VFW87_22780 [Pirellulales bacterium]|nr:hypothetical protein [Pirellulales bacterium]